MARSLISLNLFGLPYDSLKTFAQKIHDGFIAQVADYPLPNPLMPAFQADIDKLDAAIIKWGKKGNRGSHQDHLVLIAAATVVKNDLRMLSGYAQNVMPDNPVSWSAVGFTIKSSGSKPVALQAVVNLRQFIARDIPTGKIKLKWKRPLNTKSGDVKGYIVQYNNTNIQPAIDGGRGLANILGIVPNTAVLIIPPYIGDNFFWVTPFNSVGYGVSSDPLYFNQPARSE